MKRKNHPANVINLIHFYSYSVDVQLARCAVLRLGSGGGVRLAVTSSGKDIFSFSARYRSSTSVICRATNEGAIAVMIQGINSTLLRSCSHICPQVTPCQGAEKFPAETPELTTHSFSDLEKNQREITFQDGNPLSSSVLCLLLHLRKIKAA